MTAESCSRSVRWARRGAWVGLITALALPLAAYFADLRWGREMWLIAPHDPAVVALNRSMWSRGDAIADLYGSPMSEPKRVLLTSDRAVIHPAEDASLSLLPVAAGTARPIQVRTLWWAVRLAEVGVGFATAGLFALMLWLRRRERLALLAGSA